MYLYHLMPMCDVYIEVGVKFLASECLHHFFGTVRTLRSSQVKREGLGRKGDDLLELCYSANLFIIYLLIK
jgi:hypothetical protein